MHAKLARRTLLAAALPLAARGETWPDRPVRLIVPNPPGGSTDVQTRILAEPLRRELGQPVLVENRPGAGGNVGTEAVVRAAPDGLTIGSGTVTQYLTNSFLYRRLSFDAARDLVYATMTWEVANVAVVPVRFVPSETLAQFTEWGRAQPGGLAFGTPGVGTTAHLLGELFGRRAGIPVTHVPFRGAAEASPAMLRGDTLFAIDNISSYLALIRGGQVRPLAVTSATRSPLLPEVPTFAELGLPEFGLTSWGGFSLPLGTPQPIVERLATAMQRVAADPEVQRRFQDAGARVVASSPAEIVARLTNERPMWAELVRLSGATGD